MGYANASGDEIPTQELDTRILTITTYKRFNCMKNTTLEQSLLMMTSEPTTMKQP